MPLQPAQRNGLLDPGPELVGTAPSRQKRLVDPLDVDAAILNRLVTACATRRGSRKLISLPSMAYGLAPNFRSGSSSIGGGKILQSMARASPGQTGPEGIATSEA